MILHDIYVFVFRMTNELVLAPLQIGSLMKMFEGGLLERKVMAKSGCLSFITTPWEELKPDTYERQLSYKFNHDVSIFGGQVISTQRKSPLEDGQGWVVNEVMALQDIPFSDHFRVSYILVLFSFILLIISTPQILL